MMNPKEKERFTCGKGSFKELTEYRHPYCIECKHLKVEERCKGFEEKEEIE